jgi:hypothetical protein
MPSAEQRSYDRRKARVNGSASQDKTQEVRNSKSRQTGNVSVNELLISSLAMTDAPAKLLIEKGLITREEFMQKISEERGDVSEVAESERPSAVVSGSIGGFHYPIASINRIQNKKAL